METILDFFKYLIENFYNFIEKGTIFKFWRPFINFSEIFRKYLSDDTFEIVRLIVTAIILILIMLLFRTIYCKCYLKDNFKNEFTYLKDFFHPDAFLLEEMEFDDGTIGFFFVSIGCLVSITLDFIGFLVYQKYLIVAICLFLISALILICVIKSNISNMGIIKGITFSFIYIVLLIISNVIYIASIICLCFLIIFWHICIFMITSIPVIVDLAKDSDVFEDYGTTFHDYNNNYRGDYKCEGKDAFGNIILKDKDGNEILARKDKNGDVRRLDNYRHLD